MRSLDAIHLATALSLGAMYVYDERLAEAASRRADVRMEAPA